MTKQKPNHKKRALYTLLAPLFLATSHSAIADPSWELSGLIEAEASFGDNFAGADQSDIVLATIELGIDAKINDRVSGSILLLHEDDDTEPMEVDEGIISFSINDAVTLNAGRMYVPFGQFETNMVSDPLTLEIGETREAALQLAFEQGGLYGSAYIFNGDTIETTSFDAGEDTIDHNGFNIGYNWETDSQSLDVGVGYISSIGDSDALYGYLSENSLNADADGDTVNDTSTLQSYVSATAVHAVYNRGPWTGIVELVQSDKFQTGELDFRGIGAEPSAMNVEVGYGFDGGTVAVAYQGTEEALALELPETRIMVSAAFDVADATTLAVEYAADEDYSITDGGTGKDASTITAQLAVEF